MLKRLLRLSAIIPLKIGLLLSADYALAKNFSLDIIGLGKVLESLEAPKFLVGFSLRIPRAEGFGAPSWVLDTAAKRRIF